MAKKTNSHRIVSSIAARKRHEQKGYSKSEMALLRLLPKDGRRITSARLLEMKMRAAPGWQVKSHRRNVTMTMVHLMRKVRNNRETFTIERSERRGPHPVEYWIETRR